MELMVLMLSLENQTNYEQFLNARRSPITKEVYAVAIKTILGDSFNPDDFLKSAQENPTKAESFIRNWIIKYKDSPSPRTGKKPSGATIQSYLHSLKSLLEFCDIRLNWKRINQIAPKARKRTRKRPYKVEEIRKLLSHLDKRGRFAMLFYVSTGARASSIQDPRPLKVGDIKILKVGEEKIGHIKIYNNDAEEYDSFLNPECLEAMEEYLNFRKNFGETITQESPLFRSEMDLREALKDPTKIPSMLRPATIHAIKGSFERAFQAAGFENREFKMIHGLRSFFKTRLEESGMKSIYVETLLGHTVNLFDIDGYHRPSLEKLAQIYAESMSFLYIDEKYSLNIRIERAEKEKDAIKEQLYVKNKILEERLSVLESHIKEKEPEILSMVKKLLENPEVAKALEKVKISG